MYLPGGRGAEAEPLVHRVRVLRREYQRAQAQPVRLGDRRLGQANTQALAAVLFEDEQVTQPRESRAVGDEAREPRLSAVRRVETEDGGPLDRALDHVALYAGRPVGGAKEAPDHVDVEPRRIARDLVAVAVCVHAAGRYPPAMPATMLAMPETTMSPRPATRNEW